MSSGLIFVIILASIIGLIAWELYQESYGARHSLHDQYHQDE